MPEVTLRDGTRAVIRPIRPDDKDLLVAGHAQLSAETIRRRFLMPKPRLTSSDLRYLTEVDGHDHVALVAVDPEHPGSIVGVARWVRLREAPDTAEFAIVVGDPYQRRGLGLLLARALVQAARERGIARFTATALSDNEGVRKLIAAISEHLSFEPGVSAGTRDFVAELAA
ncbi:MAG: GNAT family N-acetyltransferase [Solirubrobacteraceae bacterium]